MKARVALLSLVLVLVSLPLIGQTFISAKAGLVNYEEGVQASSPRQLQEGEVFSTPNRSELLMMPGVYVRLERSAEVRMISTSVSHPEVELLSGLVSIEVNELSKESSLSVSWGDYHDMPVMHRGLYRFEVSQDGSSVRAMVQTGQLKIGNTTLKDGEEVMLASGHVGSVAKFDRKLRDDFDIWAANRDQLQSVSSYRTATAVGSSYYQGYPGMGAGFNGAWAFNPMLGYFTYLPYGMATSPWGYYYYSPSMVGYYPFPSYGYAYGGLFGYGGYGYYGYGGGGYGTSPVKQAIGTTPAQSRFPVYGTTGGNGSNGFSGTSPRSGVGFSGGNSSASAGSISRGSMGGTSSGGSGSFSGSAPRAGSVSGGGASSGATPGRH